MRGWGGLPSWPHATQGCKLVIWSWWEPVGKVSLVSGSLTQPTKDRWLLPASSHGHGHPLGTSTTAFPLLIVTSLFPSLQVSEGDPFPAKLTPLWISFANTRGSPLGSQRPRLFSLKKPISWHPIFSLIHLTWGVSSTYLKHTVLVKENHEDRSESKLWNSFLSLVACLQCREKCTT